MSEMMSRIKLIRWQHVFYMLLIAAVVAGADGCKSTGKLSKKERKAQIEAAKKQLNEIISGTCTKPLVEQDKIISEIANKNYNDPELNQLIIKAQETVKKAYAQQEKLRQQKVDAARASLLDLLLNKENRSADELEKEVNKIKAQNLGDAEIDELIARVESKIAGMRGSANVPLKNQIENAFQAIADAGKTGNVTEANSVIKRTLSLFSSEDATVLIIISREGTTVDYDKPTTISRYLNFLKDQKSSKNAVDSYQMDSGGKIKELDLIKK
jgi:hypothetical protein